MPVLHSGRRNSAEPEKHQVGKKNIPEISPGQAVVWALPGKIYPERRPGGAGKVKPPKRPGKKYQEQLQTA